MCLSKNINYLRKLHGLTREELAGRFGYTQAAIGKWERGESNPSPDNLALLSEIFGVSVDDLIKVDLKARTPVPGQLPGRPDPLAGATGEMREELEDIVRRLESLEDKTELEQLRSAVEHVRKHHPDVLDGFDL